MIQKNREIAFIDMQIAELQAARRLLISERSKVQAAVPKKICHASATVRTKEKGHATNYSDPTSFSWDQKLQTTLERVFGITKLRLCQKGVLNAVMDGRDVICIMPVFAKTYTVA